MQPRSGRLRVGILLDSLSVPRWLYTLLEEIQCGDDARIELTVLNAAKPPARNLRSRLRNLRETSFAGYARLDRLLFSRRVTHDAFETVDATNLLHAIASREVMPRQTRWSDRFADDDVSAVREAQLDVILRFGFRILRGEILESARYGVWSFHHGDNRLYRGGPALFWEMYEGNPASGTILQILTEDLDGGRVLYRSTAATNFTSLYRNRNATYWKTARFVARRLRDLRRDGLEPLLETEKVSYTRGIYRTPRLAPLLYFLARTAWRHVRNQMSVHLRREQWFVALAERPARLIGARPHFTIVECPRDRFYADPFLAEHGDAAYLFIEEYYYAAAKGVISCIELREGHASPPRVVLERSDHLSYPSVFSVDGEWFMTPETSASRTVELHRAVEFPWTWELDSVLLRDVHSE